jgi:phosphate transport system substrate-binding protein
MAACPKTTPKTHASTSYRRPSVDIDGDYTETLARIDANPNGIGVFGLAFYENNTDKLKVATMAASHPSTETISTGEYPVSRPLFFYVKKAHIGVIPGLKEYAQFFVADEIAGPTGPLASTAWFPTRNWPLPGFHRSEETMK